MLTDRIAENNPQLAVRLDQLRQRALQLPQNLQRRAEGDPADHLRAAKRRQERSQQRVELLEASPQAVDEQRAAEERMTAALQRSRAVTPVERPVPAQETAGLLAQLLNRLWYTLTDLLSVASPSAAERLDQVKERLNVFKGCLFYAQPVGGRGSAETLPTRSQKRAVPTLPHDEFSPCTVHVTCATSHAAPGSNTRDTVARTTPS